MQKFRGKKFRGAMLVLLPKVLMMQLIPGNYFPFLRQGLVLGHMIMAKTVIITPYFNKKQEIKTKERGHEANVI